MTIRHAQGEDNPVVGKFAASTAVEVGDLMVSNGASNCVPVGSLAWDSNLSTSQAAAMLKFVGVSRVKRLASQTVAADGLISTKGKFWMQCAALGADVEIGTPVGPAQTATPLLANQIVIAVANDTLAVGKVCKRALTGATEVLVELFTTLTQAQPADWDT